MARPRGARTRRSVPSLAVKELRLDGRAWSWPTSGRARGTTPNGSPLAVGPTGKVLAVDLQPEMLQLVGARAKRLGLTNVELVRSTADDPRLPAGAVDLILMVYVYHELAAPQRVLRAMKAALSPRGRIAIVEFRKEDRACADPRGTQDERRCRRCRSSAPRASCSTAASTRCRGSTCSFSNRDSLRAFICVTCSQDSGPHSLRLET